MTVTEFRDGPTPNGGVRSEIIYLKGRSACEKHLADGAEITEYDQNGAVIMRIYMALDVSAPAASGAQ